MTTTAIPAPVGQIKSGPTLPVYLTPEQIATMLQVDERTVLRWAQQDATMPATRLGRVIRFEREPLIRWLARKRPRSGARMAQERASAA